MMDYLNIYPLQQQSRLAAQIAPKDGQLQREIWSRKLLDAMRSVEIPCI